MLVTKACDKYVATKNASFHQGRLLQSIQNSSCHKVCFLLMMLCSFQSQKVYFHKKRHPYTRNLNSERMRTFKNVFLHCGDVEGPHKAYCIKACTLSCWDISFTPSFA